MKKEIKKPTPDVNKNDLPTIPKPKKEEGLEDEMDEQGLEGDRS